MVKRLQLPRKTIDGVLQELHLLGLLVVSEVKHGESTLWDYTLAEDIDQASVRALTARKSGQECQYPIEEAVDPAPAEGGPVVEGRSADDRARMVKNPSTVAMLKTSPKSSGLAEDGPRDPGRLVSR